NRIFEAIRPLARALRRAPERRLHAWRRRAALVQLAQLGVPRSVLFVCHGNICRSPYAAYAFRQRIPPMFATAMRVDSAGFVGPGRPSPGTAIESAAHRGVDLSPHRARVLTRQRVEDSDVVVVME